MPRRLQGSRTGRDCLEGVSAGLSRPSPPIGTFDGAVRRKIPRPSEDALGRRMCHARRAVYCSPRRLHELAHEPSRGRHAQPRVLAQRAAPGILTFMRPPCWFSLVETTVASRRHTISCDPEGVATIEPSKRLPCRISHRNSSSTCTVIRLLLRDPYEGAPRAARPSANRGTRALLPSATRRSNCSRQRRNTSAWRSARAWLGPRRLPTSTRAPS